MSTYPIGYSNGYTPSATPYWKKGNGQPFASPERKFLPSSLLSSVTKFLLSTTKATGAPLTSSSRPSSSSSPFIFITLCLIWYCSSALSSATGKTILTHFHYPVTLTLVQFAFVSGFCFLFTSPLVRYSRLRSPTWGIIHDTLPMGMFQVGGHMFSSIAIGKIPVSTVHTIKALSPLFTVAAYVFVFGVRYSPTTYLSLLPLTVGVMLACTMDLSVSNATGLLCAFGSAIVFVSSNIFFKRIMPGHGAHSQAGSSSQHHKLDKLNLLLYSSTMAFLLMVPMWMYYDMPRLLWMAPGHVDHPKHADAASTSVPLYFLWNGTVHFGQNIIAFIILGSTSPVTYSIASLVKRVVVIVFSIIWFGQVVGFTQGFGIVLTAAGLWLYNGSKSDVEKGETQMQRKEAVREQMLPVTRGDDKLMSGNGGVGIGEEALAHNDSAVAGGMARSRPGHSHPPTMLIKLPPMMNAGGSYPSPPLSPRSQHYHSDLSPLAHRPSPIAVLAS